MTYRTNDGAPKGYIYQDEEGKWVVERPIEPTWVGGEDWEIQPLSQEDVEELTDEIF